MDAFQARQVGRTVDLKHHINARVSEGRCLFIQVFTIRVRKSLLVDLSLSLGTAFVVLSHQPSCPIMVHEFPPFYGYLRLIVLFDNSRPLPPVLLKTGKPHSLPCPFLEN